MSLPLRFLESVLLVSLFPLPAAAQTLAAQPSTEVKPVTSVTVTAKRPQVVNKVDRKVYRTDADLQATTGSAADILGNIPSIEIDPDGSVSLRGDSSVTILVDGKPSAQMQGAARGASLQALSASDIEQIEVMTSPSAEFKADGSGGIINIVTKKKHKAGASGLVQANLGNGGRYNSNISGSYSSGPFKISGGLGLRNDIRPRTSITHILSQGASTSTTDTVQKQRESNNRRSGNIGVQYAPNDKQTFELSMDYGSRIERRRATEHSVSSAGSTTTYDRAGDGGGPRTNSDLALSFEQKMVHEGEALSMSLQTGHSIERNVYDFTTLYSAPTSYSSAERDSGSEAYGVSELSVAYVRPFASGAILKFGYDAQYDQNAFDNSVAKAAALTAPLIIVHSSDNLFRYRQTIQAVFVTYDKKWNRLEMLAGLRFEQTDVHTLQNVSGDFSAQSYSQLYPSLNLLYTLSDADTVSAGFSKRVRRRDPEDLNPYINASDPNNLRQGNPDLKPEITDSFDVGYRHTTGRQSYSLNAYYRKSRNGDTELLSVLSRDVVLIQEANLPSSQSGGLEFTASGKLLPKLSYTASGNLFYNEVNALALGAGTRSTLALNAKAALNYQPAANDRWQVSINRNGKRLTSQGYVLPVTTMNLGYRHQVTDTFALVATVTDLFNSQRPRRIFQTANFNGVYDRHPSGQLTYVGLVYTFGASKKPDEAGFGYDQ